MRKLFITAGELLCYTNRVMIIHRVSYSVWTPVGRRLYDCGTLYIFIFENSNGDISATDRPIHSVFGSMVGFSRSADRMALFPV